jgi:hypothetical protein
MTHSRTSAGRSARAAETVAVLGAGGTMGVITGPDTPSATDALSMP